MSLDVNEIFYSIDGEGIRAGQLCVFVRFNGCNLKCSYCDTEYAQCPGHNYMSVANVVEEVLSYKCPNVTLTGGEPLLQSSIYTLVSNLIDCGLNVNIETNGSVDCSDRLCSLKDNENVIITMDYKCPSSGMVANMLIGNFFELSSRDVLKFVVGDTDDMQHALNLIESLQRSGIHPNIYFSPVFGKIEPKEIVQFMKDHDMYYAKVQLQLHKFIWPPEMRGV